MRRYGDILVLGLGRSGEAAVRYAATLLAEGRATSVTAYDGADTSEKRMLALELRDLSVAVHLGCEDVVGAFDVCVVSPGIPPHAPLMRAAMSCSVRVISEVEFAYLQSDHRWVAVTGTNGKTTTTALVVHLLRVGGIDARPVGNIGTPAIAVVAEAGPDEVLVVEVSSFQLALTHEFHPTVAVLLNVTPDHIDWHGSLEQYTADKLRIFANLAPGDLAVIDVDDPGAAATVHSVAARGVAVTRVSLHEHHAMGATVADGVLTLETRGGAVRLCRADELLIRGAHNVSNALAAAAAAHAIGVSANHLRAGLASFRAIEHRLEPVGIVNGVEWFNDSKATNPDAVLKAIDAFSGTPLIVLLGGRNKGNDFRLLARSIGTHAKAAVLFGESRAQLAEAFADVPIHAVEAVSLSDAVEAARALADVGDAVVLSPACASFDEFTSYEHRGTIFKSLVTALGEESAR